MRRIPCWQKKMGYRVKLFVLRLPAPEMALARVAHRVSGGGQTEYNHLIVNKF